MASDEHREIAAHLTGDNPAIRLPDDERVAAILEELRKINARIPRRTPMRRRLVKVLH